MNERPILFKPELVRQILDGKKTQTRRIIKPGKKFILTEFDWNDGNPRWIKHCPYGKVGDILWVRETWCEEEYYVPGSDRKEIKVYYKADWLDLEHIKVVAYTHDNLEEGVELKRKWKPSIHMPKKYCRLRLLIKDVRVERIQDITVDDIIAEGIEYKPFINEMYKEKVFDSNIRGLFEDWKKLWDNINAKRGFSWETNPFVWVLSYEKM